ncbi:MAG: MarR family winged helix-turn-helix transcriptional regulator [Smithellaceae bacterium]|nr:MarR family winged helix-turn-helix transcriptional regulator [Smithellaceae bacterium]
MKTEKQTDAAALQHAGNEPHLLREIVRTHQVMMMGFSRAIGMPASRLAIMRILANALPDDIGIMDLAQRLGINAAAVTRQVKDMEEAGLIRRRLDMRDGRRSYVKLSSKGLRAFKGIHNRSHELERSLTSVIGREKMIQAAEVLVKLRQFIADLR